MKTLFNFVFKESWSLLVLIQVMFFGGIIAGTAGKEAGLLSLIIGILWFGLTALWMWGKNKKLF